MIRFSRQLSFPPDEFAAGGDTAADACDVMKIGDGIFRRTNLPPDEFSAQHIWRDLWPGQSVCNRPVTGSHVFGSSHRPERCCLWRATAPRGDLLSLCPVEFPRCHLRTPLVSRASYDVVVPVHSLLCCCFVGYVLAEQNSYDLAIILDSLWRRYHVWPDGGSVFTELHMSLYDPCRW